MLDRRRPFPVEVLRSVIEDVRAVCVVTGRVQGVFFRYSAAEVARARGVRGWVRNLPDGSVEAAFEGSRGDVEELIRWCHEGPPMAQVNRVDVSWEAPRAESGFAVRD